jgi:hypothetical protein
MNRPIRRRLPAGVTNILRTYYRAEADEIIAGLTWYRDSTDLALRLVRRDRKNGLIPGRPPVTRRAMAGILAALSPQTPWARNLRLALLVLGGERAGIQRTRLAKAVAIRDGADPLEVLKGPKERAFYLCLAELDPDAVTVDGHAYSVWAGRQVLTTTGEVTTRIFRLAADDYRRAADLCGLAPPQMQAITWLAHRRLVKSVGVGHDRNIPA